MEEQSVSQKFFIVLLAAIAIIFVVSIFLLIISPPREHGRDLRAWERLIYYFNTEYSVGIGLYKENIGLDEENNRLRFWTPELSMAQMSDFEFSPGFTIYELTNLGDNGFEKNRRVIWGAFVTDEILNVLESSLNTRSFENRAYGIYVYSPDRHIENINRISSFYSNKNEADYNFFSRTSISIKNGLVSFDESSDLPQRFNLDEISPRSTRVRREWRIIERRYFPLENAEMIHNDFFDYAFIFNFDLSESHDLDLYCFIGFKRLEKEIPFYPIRDYDSIEEIHKNRTYFNYQYFLIYPRYGFFGWHNREPDNIQFDVSRAFIEELIEGIAVVDKT